MSSVVVGFELGVAELMVVVAVEVIVVAFDVVEQIEKQLLLQLQLVAAVAVSLQLRQQGPIRNF